jgi:hypothetical protein
VNKKEQQQQKYLRVKCTQNERVVNSKSIIQKSKLILKMENKSIVKDFLKD